MGDAGSGGGSVVWSQRLAEADDWNAALPDRGHQLSHSDRPGRRLRLRGQPDHLPIRKRSGNDSRRWAEEWHLLRLRSSDRAHPLGDPGRSRWRVGGIQWGSASDGTRIYVADANSDNQTYQLAAVGQRRSRRFLERARPSDRGDTLADRGSKRSVRSRPSDRGERRRLCAVHGREHETQLRTCSR